MVENRRLTKRVDSARTLTTAHALLTTAWTADVNVLEAALRRSSLDKRLNGSCHVTFFEVAGDSQLHVNVVHLHSTHDGSASLPASTPPDGVVGGRAFDRAPRYQILRQIRDMVLA